MKIAEKIRDAEGEVAKEAATQELHVLIEKYFDDDMQRRERELAAVEDRVERLQSQLERRRSKKEEIISGRRVLMIGEPGDERQSSVRSGLHTPAAVVGCVHIVSHGKIANLTGHRGIFRAVRRILDRPR